MTLSVVPRFVGLLLLVFVTVSNTKPRLADQQPVDRNSQKYNKIWVYFTDHGEKSKAELLRAVASATVSERSLERRRNRSSGALTDVRDLPVNAAYLDALRDRGCLIRRTSKYLNAASVLATPEQQAAISTLPFVKRISPVRRYSRKSLPPPEPSEYPGPDRSSTGTAVDYGPSWDQVNQINVPPLHDAGIHGEGVLVAILDTGFNRNHESLVHLDVEAEWDFIFNDSVTSNEDEDVAHQHDHGTWNLSTMAGYAPGHLVGPAWAATFILAKTERQFEEVQGEEDDYVRALEWADSIGASVVSSSLGYLDWYTWDDMDGNTAVTTIAADIAAAKGITIATAAGNEGCCGDPLNWPGIIAPSDGDSVIAVGAVNYLGTIAAWSSRGPSRDGRIKPDVMARGISTYCAAPYDSLQYTSVNGTSLATPLVAGACALLLQMHPSWGPMDVLRELRNFASNSATPDNNYGWGIIDAYQSALYGASGIIDAVALDLTAENGLVKGVIRNGGRADVDVDVARQKQDSNGLGWGDLKIIHSIIVPGSSSSAFNDRVEGGGIYQYRVQLNGDPSQASGWRQIKLAFPFALAQSSPNPFVAGGGAQVAIPFTVGGLPTAPDPMDVSNLHEVRLEVFDVRGARVRVIYDALQTPGENRRLWDGRDESGGLVSSGVYFYRLSVDGQYLARKMVVLRR